MFSLTICFGPQNTVWNLLFKENEKAELLYDSYVELREKGVAKGIFKGRDDFGQRLTIEVGDIHGMLFEDLDASQLGQIERGLHNARSQAKAQTRAIADPALKASLMTQGPAVHSPFPNGRMS